MRKEAEHSDAAMSISMKGAADIPTSAEIDLLSPLLPKLFVIMEQIVSEEKNGNSNELPLDNFISAQDDYCRNQTGAAQN